MSAPAPSRRELILRHLEARFRGMRAGHDGYTTTWNTVSRSPLTIDEVVIGPALALFDTSERKTPEIGYYLCQLNVSLEFFYPLGYGETPSTELNRLLLDLQRAIHVDVNCGGLTVNMVESSNELLIDGPADRVVAGIVDVQVLYRHHPYDPRAGVSD